MKKILSILTSLVVLITASAIGDTLPKEETVNAATSDWLTVKGNKICDMQGNEVWLTGVNWFGFNTQRRTFDGLWTTSLYDDLRLIADHGMNLLRVPIASELILNWCNGKAAPLTWEFSQTFNGKELKEFGIEVDFVNPKYPTDLDVFNLALKYCKELGLKVMIDVHSNEISDNGHQHPVWYTEKFSVESYYQSLEWIAETYKNDDTIIAIDLKNEPHGKKSDNLYAKWDNSTDINNWKYTAEVAGKKVLDINPNLLIMVEGIEVYPKEGQTWDSPAGGYGQPENYYGAWWGGNFRGVKDYPVNLGKYQSQLVYSPHDYGPSVWEQSWFHDGFTKDSIHDEYWYDSWAYIYEDSDASYTAPLLIGEWGGFVDGDLDERGGDSPLTKRNTEWLKYLQEYIIENRIHHTFWCFNYNSSDTGGLMVEDFKVWNEPKYQFLKPALWQTQDGKFIGLSHDTPLGANGISLSEYYGSNPNPTTSSTTTQSSVTTTQSSVTTTQSSVTTTQTTTTTQTSITSTSVQPTLVGDVNTDGQIGIADLILLAKRLSGKATLSEQSTANAKCTTKPGLTGEDLLALIKFISGEVKSLPI